MVPNGIIPTNYWQNIFEGYLDINFDVYFCRGDYFYCENCEGNLILLSSYIYEFIDLEGTEGYIPTIPLNTIINFQVYQYLESLDRRHEINPRP